MSRFKFITEDSLFDPETGKVIPTYDMRNMDYLDFLSSEEEADPYVPEVVMNWPKFQVDLLVNGFLAKFLTTSNSNAFSLLLNTITVTRNLPTLQMAYDLCRVDVSLSSTELTELQAICDECGIGITL